MAPRAKKPLPIRGLTFRITVEALRNGQPWPDVDPVAVLWDKEVLAWHEGAVDSGVMVMLRDVDHRVRVAVRERPKTDTPWRA